jgi:catechol 2,3-dioxygenase-like lactoylglutathione lyase family enzyme
MESNKTFVIEGFIVVSIWADDILATSQFYRDILGLRLISHHGSRPTFSLGSETYLVICRGKSGPDFAQGSDRWPQLALKVNDLDSAIEHLAENNFKLPWGVEFGQAGRYVMLHDPAGNLIELAEFDHTEVDG